MCKQEEIPPLPSLVEIAPRYTGKLLLRNEISLSNTSLNCLLEQNVFQTKQPLEKRKNKYVCMRCGNMKQSLIGKIPAQHKKDATYYCRNCIEMGRVTQGDPLYTWNGPQVKWHRFKSPCSWKGTLTSAQEEAADRVIQAIQNREEELLIWAVCGSGKTEMLFPGITKSLQEGLRICIATPRADVVRELLPRIKQAFPTIGVQALYGGSKEKEGSSQIIIATTHQLLRFQAAFDVMIIDEVDAFPYHADDTLPFVTKRACMRESVTIYLTATPRSSEKQRMIRHKLPHIFVPIRFHGRPLPVPQFQFCFTLSKYMKKQLPPPKLLNDLTAREKQKRQILIFVSTITVAEKFYNYFYTKFKMKSMAYVHAEDANREEKVQQFRDKKIDILLTTTILERGVTFPSVDVLVVDSAHAIFDEAALVQIAGRAGRSSEDPNGEVIFYHDGKSNAMIEARRSIK